MLKTCDGESVGSSCVFTNKTDASVLVGCAPVLGWCASLRVLATCWLVYVGDACTTANSGVVAWVGADGWYVDSLDGVWCSTGVSSPCGSKDETAVLRVGR